VAVLCWWLSENLPLRHNLTTSAYAPFNVFVVPGPFWLERRNDCAPTGPYAFWAILRAR
jgi:hypothetical protein